MRIEEGPRSWIQTRGLRASVRTLTNTPKGRATLTVKRTEREGPHREFLEAFHNQNRDYLKKKRIGLELEKKTLTKKVNRERKILRGKA